MQCSSYCVAMLAYNIYFLDYLLSRLLEPLIRFEGPMSKTIHSDGQLTLVAELIRVRKAAGLSQADLSSRLHCHQSLIARIESGQRRIDVPEFIIICRAAEADPIEVLEVVMRAIPNDLGI